MILLFKITAIVLNVFYKVFLILGTVNGTM